MFQERAIMKVLFEHSRINFGQKAFESFRLYVALHPFPSHLSPLTKYTHHEEAVHPHHHSFFTSRH
jgi:hypothetical protein